MVPLSEVYWSDSYQHPLHCLKTEISSKVYKLTVSEKVCLSCLNVI
jgi:hypothetical protein